MDSPVQHDFVVVSDLIAPVILEHQKVMSYVPVNCGKDFRKTQGYILYYTSSA